MFAKHAAALRNLIPFGDDPYDAVGSYAVMVGSLLAAFSVISAFLAQDNLVPSSRRFAYVRRSQEAVLLIVLGALAADIVAMARHWEVWIHAPASTLLGALIGGVAIVEIALSWLVLVAKPPRPSRRAMATAILTTIAALVILSFYPEQLITRLDTHLLTNLIAAVLLFAPVRFMLEALVPLDTSNGASQSKPSSPKRWGGPALIFIIAFFVGFAAFISEISDGTGNLGVRHLLIVGAVFIGLGMAGVLIAYGFLAQPLGLSNSAPY